MPAARKSTRQTGDFTSAYKVISCGLIGLSRAEIFVAHAILRHLSNVDDTCFPSVERLAAMSGTDRSSVIRATARLCTGENRLFDKFRKQGRGRTSTANYTIRWSRIRELEVQIEAAFRGEFEEYASVNSLTGATLNSRTGATLTYNQLTPDSDPQCVPTSQASSSKAEEKPKATSEPKPKKALEERGVRVEVAPQAKVGRRGMKNANERWNADVLQCGVEVAGRIFDWMTEDVADEATKAERQRYKLGISTIRDKLIADGKTDLARIVSKYCPVNAYE